MPTNEEALLQYDLAMAANKKRRANKRFTSTTRVITKKRSAGRQHQREPLLKKARHQPASFADKEQNKPIHTPLLPPHRRVLAPMVGGSELPFRMLCRRYGADLCYTPMIYSGKFVHDKEYRQQAFNTAEGDRPLVAHFCGNDPQVLLQAARLVEDQVDAIDLNLGCPQRIAHSGHFGSYLLGDEDRPLVVSIVRTLARGLSVPVFCKIRLLHPTNPAPTVCLVEQLRAAGAALVAVHARQRGTATRRREGPAQLDQIRAITAAVQSAAFPILSNGNVRCASDVAANLASTGAAGIMSAEGLLDNPTLFMSDVRKPKRSNGTGGHPAAVTTANKNSSDSSNSNDSSVRRSPPVAVALEYLQLVDEHASAVPVPTSTPASAPAPVSTSARPSRPGRRLRLPQSTLVFHVRRMLKDQLARYQLMPDCLATRSVAELRAVLRLAQDYETGRAEFAWDDGKEARVRAEAVRRKEEQGKRREYEKRMVRKAKREGKPLDHYTRIGLAPPSRADVEHACRLMQDGSGQRRGQSQQYEQQRQQQAEAVAWWRKRFGQHCFAHHCLREKGSESGCKRDRGCAFLHAELRDVDAEPSWLAES